MESSDAAAWGLAALLGFAGAAHFVNPGSFDEIVPHLLPGSSRRWTYLSGLAELACAAGIVHPSTRRAAALGAACLFVAVFPANVQMAVDWRSRPALERAGAYGRLPLQLPLVWWALRVRADSVSSARRRR
ncbi:MAG: MauE/DoxX family redox-associated membrane protein [Acidimicrobiia bacterium]